LGGKGEVSPLREGEGNSSKKLSLGKRGEESGKKGKGRRRVIYEEGEKGRGGLLFSRREKIFLFRRRGNFRGERKSLRGKGERFASC